MNTKEKWWPWLLTGLFGLWMVSALRPAKEKSAFQQLEFGKLPVLLEGRVQPLDSVARNSLLQIRGQQQVPLEGNGSGVMWGDWLELRAQGAEALEERWWWHFSKHPKKLKATPWLMEVLMKPESADQRPVFLIHHPELLGELKLERKGVENSGLRYYAFTDLEPSLRQIEAEAKSIGTIKSEVRTPYQKAVMNLSFTLHLYLRLKNSLKAESTTNLVQEIEQFQQAFPAGMEAFKRRQSGENYDQEALNQFLRQAERYDMLAEFAYLLLIPPQDPANRREDWSKAATSLLEAIRTQTIHPATQIYAAMCNAYRENRPDDFNRALAQYQHWLIGKLDREAAKCRQEFFFNQYQPFYKSMTIYVLALLLACASWLNWSQWLNRSAFLLVGLAFVVHTSGLVFRMYLEGRPPVTNLYSSAIFVGWGAVLLGLILERWFRDGIGSVTASAIGFLTLIIAHHLSLSGDTMIMLRAVLDTNFWLATHVVVITVGYASTFLAGFLAIVYILRGVFTKTLAMAVAKSLNRMVYGIVCFATLFSFVGTVLGGIWADQSWGRFWGWDPKENGALLIVIWNALILHARWGGLVRERGLMNLAVFGNIVTSFSWFGVNMLGIGLHSYGFMDAAFVWLMLFVGSQLALIGLGLLPEKYWASFRRVKATANQPSGAAPPAPMRKPDPASARA